MVNLIIRKSGAFRRTSAKLEFMPEVRAPFLSSTEPLKTSVPITGIIVVLVLLVVTRAVIWIKKLSGREGREGSEFSCLTGGFKPR